MDSRTLYGLPSPRQPDPSPSAGSATAAGPAEGIRTTDEGAGSLADPVLVLVALAGLALLTGAASIRLAVG